MCCCGSYNVNGTFGYKWQPTDSPGVYSVNPPDLQEHDTLLFDEPGRCGGIDSHSHHYRIVKMFSSLFLLVKRGGGQERIRLSLFGTQEGMLSRMVSNDRYWMLNALYHAYEDGRRIGTDKTSEEWRNAAAEKRIVVRKIRGRNSVRVSIKHYDEVWGTLNAHV